MSLQLVTASVRLVQQVHQKPGNPKAINLCSSWRTFIMNDSWLNKKGTLIV